MAAVPWGWAVGAAGCPPSCPTPTAGLSSVAVVGCCPWECLCLSLEKGAGSAVAETTRPLNVLLFLPVVPSVQPSVLCLDFSLGCPK